MAIKHLTPQPLHSRTLRQSRLLILLLAIGLVAGMLQPSGNALAFSFTAVRWTLPSAPGPNQQVQVNVNATAAAGETVGIKTTAGSTTTMNPCSPYQGDATSWYCAIAGYPDGTLVTYQIYEFTNNDTNCQNPANCNFTNVNYGYYVSSSTTTPHTIYLDGVNDFRSTEALETSNGVSYYTTWDATNLYVLMSGGNIASDHFNIAFDTDPGGTNGSSGCWGGTTFPQFGRPDYVFQFNGSNGTLNFATPNGTTGWTSGDTSDIGVKIDVSVNNLELRIPRSKLGNLSPSAQLGLYMYLSYGNGGLCSNERTQSFAPSANPTSSSAVVTPFDEYYFQTTDDNRSPNQYLLQQLDLFTNISFGPSSGNAFNDVIFEGGTLYLFNGYTINIKRNWTYISGTFTPNNSTVNFNGSGLQILTGPATFGQLAISNTGSGVTFSNGVSVNSGLTINAGGKLNGGTGNITFANGAVFTNNGTFTPSSSTVIFPGSGSVGGASTTSFNNVNISGSVDFGARSTINGTFQINAGGAVSNNAPTYGNASTLLYNTGINMFAGLEWQSGVTSGQGAPQNVTLANATILNLGSADHTARGTVTIQNNAALIAPSTTLNIGGGFINNGTFNHNGGILNFNGGVTQNLTLSTTTTFNDLTVGSGTILNENVAANNAIINGTLTNNGTIRKILPVLSTGQLVFGLTKVSIKVTIQGTLSSLQVDRIDSTPPNPIAVLQPDRYWNITPTGASYQVDLTLPHNISNPIHAQACRYTGSTWDCDRSTADSTTVTRTGVTQLSPWAVADITPSAPVISKTFSAASVPLTGTTTLTFNVTNPNHSVDLHNIVFTDTLNGLQVAQTPATTNGCDVTFAPTAGDTILSVEAMTLTANTSCSMSVDLQPTAAGAISNTTNPVTADESGPGSASNTATLNVGANPPVISTGFTPDSIPVTGTTVITYALTNPNAAAISGVSFTDTLPSALKVTNSASVVNDCGGTTTASAGASSFALANATLQASSTCVISVNITPTTIGVFSNTTSVITANESPAGLASNVATLTVTGPPSISTSFAPSTVITPSGSTLVFTLTNLNPTVTMNEVAFGDTLPAGLSINSPSNLTSTCNGVVTATAGSGSVAYSGGTLSPGQSCTIRMDVVAGALGVYSNTTGNLSSSNGGTGGPSNTATLTVLGPPSIGKSFSISSGSIAQPISVTFAITNPNPSTALHGISFSDVLTTGLQVATPPNATNTCSGSLDASAGSTTISLTNGVIAAGTVCRISVYITGSQTGVFTNTTSPVASTEAGSGTASNTATMTLTENTAAPQIHIAFSAASIAQNGSVTLTFTITNPNITKAQSGISFTDTLSNGLVVANTPNVQKTCTGTLTAAAGSSQITLSGASLTPGQSCTISVVLKATTAGSVTNTTGAIRSTESGAGSASNTATVLVVAPPQISTAFADQTIQLNGVTRLNFTLTNPNSTAALSEIAFTDTLPAGIQVVDPPDVQNTCGGSVIYASGSAGLSNGTLAPGAQCTISIKVTGVANGVYTNSTGTISSREGGTGSTSNSAKLTVARQVFLPMVIRTYSAGW